MHSAPEKRPPSRWWRWLKRLLLAGCALVVLAAVFHQTLLRALLRYGGPHGASLAGIRLQWQVDGSVTGDLRLSQIEASGLMIDRATIGEFSAAYDTMRAVQTGDTDIIKSIALKNVEASVDLRKLPKSTEAPKPPAPSSGKPPPLVWPAVIDLENLNAKLILADGRTIILRGLTLRIGEGMPGIFRCQEFSMTPGGLHLANVSAQVRWGSHMLAISDLALPYGAHLKNLQIDLRKWTDDSVNVALSAGMGKGSVSITALAQGIFAGLMQLQTDVKVSGLASEDLQALPLPKDISFGPVNVAVQAVGDPLKPAHLTVSGNINLPNIKAAGATLDAVSLAFESKNGLAKISEAKITRGTNEITLTADAKLADEVMRSTWTAKLTAKISDITQLLDHPPPAQGVIELNADAQGIGATPTKAVAHLRGKKLAYTRYRLPELTVDVSLDGKEAKVNVPALMLGTGNRIDVNAAMTMEDTMPIKADWRIQIDDPATLIKTVNLPPLTQPLSAKLSSSGQATLKANDPMNANATLQLVVKEGRLGDAPLPSVEVQAEMAKGAATLKSCRVIVDEKNHLDLNGKANLQAPWSFAVNGTVQMPELKSLNSLLTAFKAPAIESGSLKTLIDVKGDASPWRGSGSISMQAGKVKVSSMPDAADVNLQTTFAGTTATLQELHATLGPWRLLAAGTVTDKRADLSDLSFWQKERRLMGGHARAAYDLSSLDVLLTAKELPIHEVAAAAGVKNVPQALFNSEIAIRSLEDAHVVLNLKDVKAPGVPKSLPPAQVDVSTVLHGGTLTVDAKVEQKPLQPLVLHAQTPVVVAELMKKPDSAKNLPLKATLNLAESDLSFVRDFAPKLIKAIPAKLKLTARVDGTLTKPLIDSALDLNATEVLFTSADLPSVRDVRVRVRTHDRTLLLEDISTLLAGGRVRLGGSINATQTDNPHFDLKVTAREALVFRNPTSSLRANADIACVGSLKAARVSGIVEAVRGRIFQEVNLLPNVMSVVKQSEPLPPPPPSTAKTSQKMELPPLLKDWTFDVKVRTRDPVLLAGNLVNGAISADIALGGTGARPRLTGFANVDRLLLKLPFSLLKITKGVVTMDPNNPFAPKLDVRGESRIGSNDITLYVYGDASNPKTRFTSTPPMSEADIVTLIGTGMTLGGDNAQMASEAMSRAAFLVISETWRKMFNKTKKVSDEPPKLHMSFNPSGGDRANDSMQAMYEVTPSVRFTGRFTQSGRMKALLGYVLRFGKAARAVEEAQR